MRGVGKGSCWETSGGEIRWGGRDPEGGRGADEAQEQERRACGYDLQGGAPHRWASRALEEGAGHHAELMAFELASAVHGARHRSASNSFLGLAAATTQQQQKQQLSNSNSNSSSSATAQQQQQQQLSKVQLKKLKTATELDRPISSRTKTKGLGSCVGQLKISSAPAAQLSIRLLCVALLPPIVALPPPRLLA